MVIYEKAKREGETAKKEFERMEVDYYFADCLWAMATDMRFISNKKPTLPRLIEIRNKNNPSKKVAQKITKKMVKEKFLRLKG